MAIKLDARVDTLVDVPAKFNGNIVQVWGRLGKVDSLSFYKRDAVACLDFFGCVGGLLNINDARFFVSGN